MTSHELAKKLLDGPDLPVCHLVTSEMDGSQSIQRIDLWIRAPDSNIPLPSIWEDSDGDHPLALEPVIILADLHNP